MLRFYCLEAEQWHCCDVKFPSQGPAVLVVYWSVISAVLRAEHLLSAVSVILSVLSRGGPEAGALSANTVVSNTTTHFLILVLLSVSQAHSPFMGIHCRCSVNIKFLNAGHRPAWFSLLKDKKGWAVSQYYTHPERQWGERSQQIACC